MTTIQPYRRLLDRALAQRATIRSTVAKERAERKRLRDLHRQVAEALALTRTVAAAVQHRVHATLAAMVGRCLQAVFDDPYEFQIVFETKRSRTEARLVFVRDGVEIDPMTAAGGGVVDVAAFALRLGCLLLARPPVRKLLVLDEPFRFVSADHHHQLRALLTGLAAELGVQIIMVTHVPALEIGMVYRLYETS